MKKTLRLLILPLLLAAPATPAAVTETRSGPSASLGSEPLKLTVQASLGVAQGEAREVVYASDELGRRFKLSELFWDMDDVMMAGGTLTLQVGPRFRLQGAFWAAVTEGQGRMDDYDWLAGPDLPWTDWSLSDVEVKEAYTVDLSASAEVYRRGALTLSAIVGYRQDHWSWEDQLIGYIYSTDGFRDTVGYGDGQTAITYEQTFYIPYAGVSAGLQKGPASAELFFHFSPLVWAEDDDYHLLRDTRFQVEADGGDYYGAGLRVGYEIAPRLTLGLAAEWQVMEEVVGDTTIQDDEGSETVPDSGGIASQWMVLSGSLGYRF